MKESPLQVFVELKLRTRVPVEKVDVVSQAIVDLLVEHDNYNGTLEQSRFLINEQ